MKSGVDEIPWFESKSSFLYVAESAVCSSALTWNEYA